MSESLGPVSEALQSEIRQLLARKQLVVWLDTDSQYGDFIDRLITLRQQDRLTYNVHTFRGSHLELLLELEEVSSQPTRPQVLIHLPGYNEETVRTTPVLELYAAGTRYRKSPPTLVREAAAGIVPPEQIEAFLDRDGLTLAAADAWLQSMATRGTEGLAGELHDVRLIELVDGLLSVSTLAERVLESLRSGDGSDRQALRDRINALTGMPESWHPLLDPSSSTAGGAITAEGLAEAIASWAMCVSYVSDLTGPPKTELLQPVSRLPQPVQAACCELTEHLQQRHADFYRRTADETEPRLIEDREVEARDLGRFDTFRFEEEKIFKASLDAIQAGKWADAAEWSERRSAPDALWLRDDPLRRNMWQLVADCARLGLAVAAADQSLPVTGLESAVEEYTRTGAEVDRAHRHLEQNRRKLLRSQMSEFVAVRACLDHMRDVWHAWADARTMEFNTACRTHGFLPDRSRQQRTLFDEVVRPLTSPRGTTAYFLVDALRYEMAEELLAAIPEGPTDVRLDWRLAELPTVTAVGMNVLAPVTAGSRLQPQLKRNDDGRITGISAFSSGELKVSDPPSRQRAIRDRIGGSTCPSLKLQEVVDRSPQSLARSIARAELIVIESREIDVSGEDGVGTSVFEDVLKDLRSAWRLLRDAGVQNFVITADHGFLLLHEGAHSVQPHDRQSHSSRRYIITDRAADHTGEVRVPLRDLEYDGDDLHVMFPESLAVYGTGRPRKGFVHGGNSLQERVIPVLTVVHRARSGGSTTSCDITARKKQGVADMHCISARVSASQKSLAFADRSNLELGLRVREVEGVQVELCETRGQARLESGVIVAEMDVEFELFFRLTGNTRSRVQVELYHPGAGTGVEPFVLTDRFELAPSQEKRPEGEGGEAVAEDIGEAWLEDLPEGPVRRVFHHLWKHGSVTTPELVEMLGSPTAQRRFSRNFENYKAKAPFPVRIDVVQGVNRYVREGGTT